MNSLLAATLQLGERWDDNDVHSAALCAWKEARGEDKAGSGMQAVLCVLRNRIGARGFAHNLHDVIYGKNQFTSMSVPSDPEFNLDPEKSIDVTDKESWNKARGLANLVFGEHGEEIDITDGAHYYANLHNVTSGWFFDNIVKSTEHPIVAQIGKHTFFA